jgi:hypothetical protein
MDRKVYRADECPQEIVDAIANSTMDPKYDELNHLLEDEDFTGRTDDRSTERKVGTAEHTLAGNTCPPKGE